MTPSKVLPPGLGAVGKIFVQYIFPPLNDSNINNANLMYYVFYIVNNIPLIIFSSIIVGRRFIINTLIFMVCQTAFHIIINGNWGLSWNPCYQFNRLPFFTKSKWYW
nr:YitT family protein [Spiroplasma mirum]